MLSGDNGLLKRAGDARDDSIVGQEKEQVELAYISAAVNKLGGDVEEEDLRIELNNSVGTGKTTVSTKSDLTLKVKFEDTGNEYTVTKDGTVEKYVYIPLASDILKVDVSATTDVKKSPYVNYTDVNGNTILCRVLYNDETNGLQIISSNSITTITLGYEDTQFTVSDFVYEGTATLDDDFRISASSYNRAITTLNEKSEKYLDLNGIAYKARCVGSNPINSSDITETSFTSTRSYMTTYSLQNKFKVNDTNDQTDFDQMGKLEIRTSDSACWLASRTAGATASDASFYIKGLDTDGSFMLSRLCYVNSDGTNGSYSYTYGLRPVFHLSDGVKITSGSGTQSDPYTLGK